MTTLECASCGIPYPSELGGCPRCQASEVSQSQAVGQSAFGPWNFFATTGVGKWIFSVYLALVGVASLIAMAIKTEPGSNALGDYLIFLIIGAVSLPTSLLVMPLLGSFTGLLTSAAIALLLNIGLAALLFLMPRHNGKRTPND